eukprot:357202-Chlamydomonas_euryale.AAC.19
MPCYAVPCHAQTRVMLTEVSECGNPMQEPSVHPTQEPLVRHRWCPALWCINGCRLTRTAFNICASGL